MAFPAAAAGAPASAPEGDDGQRGEQCVLVPVSDSPAGESKLAVAAAQAHVAGAPVVLLHILPETRPSADGSVLPAEAYARTYLDTLATRLRAGKTLAKTLVRSGPVDTTVTAVARELAAKMVVIGSDTTNTLARVLPGRGGRHARHGGHASAILRAAPCPVLLVPPSPGRAVEAPAVRRFEEDAVRSGPVEPRGLGHRSVDVARIVGAIGDLGDLGADFRPRRTREERAIFRRTVRAMEREMARELEHEAARPVLTLRKLGYGYYVATEPHQVAAARHLQRRRIVAEVTEYVSLHDEVARQAFEARRAFERTTGLTRIGAALPETYEGIEALVRAFGGSQGIPDVREAAMRWDAAVFRPLQVRLRERRLQEWFPGERSADVVLRVARFDLAGGRRAASWDEVLDGFVAAWRRRRPGPEAAA